MNMNNIVGQRIFQNIQKKVAMESKVDKAVSYCDLYSDDGNYCTDHHDTDRGADEGD